MKKGDIVKFKKLVDLGDESALMILIANPDGGRVLVQHLVDMAIQPTHVYPVDDLIVCVAVAKYRIVPAPATGIGWVAVQVWNGDEYRHVTTFRSKEEAEAFISREA